MNRRKFFRKVSGIVKSKKDIVRISQAYWLAKEIHRRQNRDGGERYFEHCRRVACSLIDKGDTGANEIIISLLHDCEEDGLVPQGLFRVLFGKYVAKAVGILSKKVSIFDKTTAKIVKKRKKGPVEYFQAIRNADKTVRRIKLADRLDNLRSFGIWPKSRKEKYLKETRKYLIPIARKTDEDFLERIKKLSIKTN